MSNHGKSHPEPVKSRGTMTHERPSVLCIDLGNYSTKQTLAFVNDNNVKEIVRVGFSVDFDHPERPDRKSQSLYEFISSVGLKEDNTPVEGRKALDEDVNFALKEAVIWAATGEIEIVRGCPRGPELLQALEAGIITKVIIDDLLRQHLEFLREQALRCAKRQSLEILVIALTYPNFLGRRTERSGDQLFEKYATYLKGHVRSVWGDGVQYEYGSEGQAVAAYICETFRDSAVGREETLMRDLFPTIAKSEEVVLAVVDGGSSGMVCGRLIPCLTLH